MDADKPLRENRNKRKAGPPTSTADTEMEPSPKRRKMPDTTESLQQESLSSSAPRPDMDADKPPWESRNKRKGDPPTSTADTEMEPSPKRRKMPDTTESLQQESLGSSAPRLQQYVDLDVMTVTPGFADLENTVAPAEQVECAEEGTSSDKDTMISSTTEVSMDPISSLPILVQDKIFGFLKGADKVKAAQVCSTWHNTVYRPYHWRQEKVLVDLNQMTVNGLSSVALREIGRVQICGDDERKMQDFLKQHQSMISLHLSSKKEANIFFHTMSVGQFSSLTQLTLTTDDNACGALSSQQVLGKLTNLRTLSISGSLSNDLIQAICGELGGLKELSLSSCKDMWDVPLRIQGLAQLNSLHTLCLEDAFVVDFFIFCKLNKTLRKLMIYTCLCFDDAWLTDLSQITSLEELDLRGCLPDNVGLEPLSQRLVNLKKITVWPAKDSIVRLLGSPSTLEEVELLWTTEVEDETFHALSDNLTHLRTLTLSKGSCITSECLERFGHIATLQKLHLDGVTHSSCISDFLRSLNQSSCRLKSLILTEFPQASRSDMQHIAKISTLQELYLGGLDGGFSMLMELHHATFQLKALELKNCRVTMEEVMPLLGKQVSLRKLVIKGKEVDDKNIPPLYTILPNLETLVLEQSMEETNSITLDDELGVFFYSDQVRDFFFPPPNLFNA